MNEASRLKYLEDADQDSALYVQRWLCCKVTTLAPQPEKLTGRPIRFGVLLPVHNKCMEIPNNKFTKDFSSP